MDADASEIRVRNGLNVRVDRHLLIVQKSEFENCSKSTFSRCKCAHGRGGGECSNERNAPLGAKVKHNFVTPPSVPSSGFTNEHATNANFVVQGSSAVVVLVGGTAADPYSYKYSDEDYIIQLFSDST